MEQLTLNANQLRNTITNARLKEWLTGILNGDHASDFCVIIHERFIKVGIGINWRIYYFNEEGEVVADAKIGSLYWEDEIFTKEIAEELFQIIKNA